MLTGVALVGLVLLALRVEEDLFLRPCEAGRLTC
jgi:hypothetical protein